MRLDSVEGIARGLHDSEVRFIVVDGLAVVAHGYGRGTDSASPTCCRATVSARL